MQSTQKMTATHTDHKNIRTDDIIRSCPICRTPIKLMDLEDVRTGRETDIIRAHILHTLNDHGLQEPPLTQLLDHTIDLFESRSLGRRYYGYHNIHHELAVTYVMLLSACSEKMHGSISDSDIKHLYAAALLHDFDPRKSVDKPHEKMVLEFISNDTTVTSMIKESGIDLSIVKALILSTTYPWNKENRRQTIDQIMACFAESEIAKDDAKLHEHYMHLGRCLSVVDRIAGYSLGNFAHSIELAKMNAHALAWKPSWIVRRSVAYFESLMSNETDIFHMVIKSLPTEMRKNFFDTVMEFMKLRNREIAIQADFEYDNLRFRISMDTKEIRNDPGFVTALRSIYNELPRPLQFLPDKFEESISNPEVVLNTIRISNGSIIGFAKGGPLEYYSLGTHIQEKNLGLYNTVFLEPLALRSGYWGLGGGSKMRSQFIMQATAKRFKYLASFALRDVIESRLAREPIEHVQKIDPERWDYYRLRL